MIVRITQLDGRLPNLALMKLSAYHRARGDDIHFSRSPYRDMLEPDYDRVYGSAIFDFSADRVRRFKTDFPQAIVGGTWNMLDLTTVEEVLGEEPAGYDYSIYPTFQASLGFAIRGCRLKCGFCVVHRKEGTPSLNSRIYDIWRGDGYPRHLHLLDNDFFGHPSWREHIADIREGGFRVCFNQGINIRMITDETAEALASVRYYDDEFEVRRLYTAWDSIGDEKRFFDGVDTLEKQGVPARHLMAYMLIGYDKRETWERVFYRLNKMMARGIKPYPMIYGEKHRTIPLGGFNQDIERRTLGEFQRWVIRKAAEAGVPFSAYNVNAKGSADARQSSFI